MRPIALLAAIPLLLAACQDNSNLGNSSEALEEAAEVSDPAAAQVLENAAENGMDPQEALREAGNAQAQTVPGGGDDTNSVANAAANGQ